MAYVTHPTHIGVRFGYAMREFSDLSSRMWAGYFVRKRLQLLA
jgi:hypothetical protein